MKIYLVGGAVRDALMGVEVKDKDWVVINSHREEMLTLGYQQVGKDFPVFLHPVTKEEYALARIERKSGIGYTGFQINATRDVSLEQDLARRDLTINAIAQSEDGDYIDPYHGLADLKNKVLHHVTDAFSEDPLRVLRVARFKARFHDKGFKIAPDTLKLMQHISTGGELESISAERIWVETRKALSENSPEEYFLTLRLSGALDKLFPEINHLFGVPQRKEYHPEIDTGVHTMMVLQQASKLTGDLEVRFAALLHDLGKALTPEDVLPKHIGHEKRSLPLIKTLCKRIKVPKSYEQLALLVAEYHTHCHRAFELKAATLIKLLESLGAYRKPKQFFKFLQACEADAKGRTGFELKPYPQADFLLQVYNVSVDVDTQAFIASGLQGKAIGNAIHQHRVTEVKKLITTSN